MPLTYEFRILIIDDNPEIHHDFIKILTNTSNTNSLDILKQQIFDTPKSTVTLPHFKIDVASQGEEGYERIKVAMEENKPYALAFVDVRMPPGWDGIETIKRIWTLDDTIQVVICTAYSDYSWEETIKELGKSDNLLILKKPFDYVAVRQLASALTKKWQLFRESRIYTIDLEKSIKDQTLTLQHSLSCLKATLESSTDGILVIDRKNNIVDSNKKFMLLWHIPDYLKREKNFELFINFFKNEILDSYKFLKEIQDYQSNSEKIGFNQIKLKNNSIYEYYTQPQKLNEKTIGRIFSFRDVTSQRLLEDKLKFLATHDSLTGLPNRVLLNTMLQDAIFSNKNSKLFAVLFMDLDRFKLINDSLTHAAGDELLQHIAERFQYIVNSATQHIARLGGDEFVMITENLSNTAEIITLIENLKATLNQPFTIEGHKIIITMSIGISVYPTDGATADILLRNADSAMYVAKKAGSGFFRFYSKELNSQNLAILEKEIELRQALNKKEFFLMYQPQIELNTGRLVAVEALIRWQHPKLGLILPLDFIPLAEETGLIIPIGEWVLKTACRQNKLWQERGYPLIRVSVNVTAEQLNQPNFINLIKSTLEDTQLLPEYLELELTENTIMSHVDNAKTIKILKNLGIHIAIDDFGTGYSSLSYLKDFKLDRLKIDRSFVQNIEFDQADEIIIKAIITMAHSLNLDVIAEGVETKEQIEFLKKLKCGDVQGFYFNKPLRPEELEALFETLYKNEILPS
jgi:diguanylate cyclase (GGDEF)-like protein